MHFAKESHEQTFDAAYDMGKNWSLNMGRKASIDEITDAIGEGHVPLHVIGFCEGVNETQKQFTG